MRELTIGSLFDGSGGFPLAAALEGIRPVWASEVEPYPIAVTRSRFPNMKHEGDVSQLNGATLEPVDIITFGSPCQDLSVAGKRAGLKHEAAGDEETTRSGLFIEAIRIIREMREATHGLYPTFAIWENVTGAFSSSKGEDFRTVLNEFVGIVEPGAEVPPPPQGRWPYADVLVGDGWSVAYRTFDAQYWGVPQRRRRIYLVADFRGERAGEILFKREGMRGHPAPRREAREGTATNLEDGSGTTDSENVRGIINLNKGDYQNRRVYAPEGVAPTPGAYTTSWMGPELYVMATQQANAEIAVDKSPTITAAAGMSGNNQPIVAVPYTLKIRQGVERDSAGKKAGKGPLISENLSMALGVSQDQYLFQPQLYENHSQDSRYTGPHEVAPTTNAKYGTGGNNQPLVVLPIHDKATRHAGKRGEKHDGAGNGLGVGADGDPMFTLMSGDHHAVCYWDGGQVAGTLTANNANGAQRMPDKDNFNCVLEDKMEQRYIVRRLTPLECCRLQGFPDGWGETDAKEDFTDEEFEFWLDVRNTHGQINGKAIRHYTKAQMLTWYNKLHTDSAEYKMWGNGIALPCALYVMQGIVDAVKEEEENNV